MTHTFKTSGSTGEPKTIVHDDLTGYAYSACGLYTYTHRDRVLNLYPVDSIAHKTLTAGPMELLGGENYDLEWNPYAFCRTVEEFKPTVVGMAPGHLLQLLKTKDWYSLDMSGVRGVILGAAPVDQHMINQLHWRGVDTVYHTYGMTENPPPVFIGKNTPTFSLRTVNSHLFEVEFPEGHLHINGKPTNDIFDVDGDTITFLRRTEEAVNTTWKYQP